jgi:hypothetical protein
MFVIFVQLSNIEPTHTIAAVLATSHALYLHFRHTRPTRVVQVDVQEL